MQTNQSEANEFLRIKNVVQLTTLSKSHIYGLIRNGEFPKPVKLTENTSVWIKSEVDEWIASRVEARQQ
jgi:prophage regulatory protein